MPRVTAPPLPDHCPWGGYTPPNVDWCEEQLCAWIVNPADTWSNLAYIVVGLWMWRATRIAQGSALRPNAVLRLFGPSAITVGVFSFVYHASYTYFLQFFDFVGMFLFCFTVISANGLRLGWFAPGRQLVCFGAGVLLFSALVPVLSATLIPIQSLVGLLVATIIGQEALIRQRASGEASARSSNGGYFWLALLLLAGAAAASLADVTRTWCDPQNHWLQGHSIWHLLSAAALYALYRFYAGLPGNEPAQSAGV